jgi:ATP-dependent Clp protease ATP-binding subunit ClpC
MFERYTERARRALFFARWEVSQRGASAIGTEHILLGVLRDPKGLVERLVSPEQIAVIQLDIDQRSPRRAPVPSHIELPFTDETQRVLHSSAEEADALGHSYIGTEHLLLGLLCEESLARSILRKHGFELARARSRIVELLRARADERPDAADMAREIEQLKKLVDRLAHQLSDQEASKRLIEQIRFHLERLQEGFRT